MLLLTLDASMACSHQGRVRLVASQQWFTLSGRPVLVEPDPEGRTIVACPNIGPTIKPCTTTLKVQVGYSTLVTIGGKPACLDSVTGLTDGTPPGTVPYRVLNAGQTFVEAVA